MAIQLTDLPYSTDALQPCISQNTLEFHYLKHHKHYVDKLNELTAKTRFDQMKLEEIVLESWTLQTEKPEIFNNAAQAWNHDFYWKCMSPHSMGPLDTTTKSNQTNAPTGLLSEDCYTLIRNHFGSLETMKAKFIESASHVFGSGWTWLVKNPDDSLAIVNTSNADTPIVHQQIPLLTCDVWEHAYYLDYQNERERYLSGFMKIVNWNFVEDNLYRTYQGFHRSISRKAREIGSSWNGPAPKTKWQNEGYV